MIRTPAHKQTDPNKAPGTCSFDRYPYMKHSTAKTPEIEQYLHQYIARKQEEPPKKLTFEEWWSSWVPSSLPGTGEAGGLQWFECFGDIGKEQIKEVWNAAQENT